MGMTMNKMMFITVLLCISFVWTTGQTKRPKVLGVAHMAFVVSDLQKSRAFYGDYLGFHELYAFKGKDGVERTAIFKINDNQYIELVVDTPHNDGRLSYIAFYTDDIKAMLEYLSSEGVKVPEKIDKGRAGNLAFNIIDPEGHTVEITQYESESWTSREKGKSMPETRIATRIEHIGVTAGDEEAEKKFYTDILGFVDQGKPQVPEGDERIEFGTYRKPPTPQFRGSRNHLCLIASPGVEKAVEILKGRNPALPVETHVLQKSNWHANVYDPDGTRIELVDH
jgi:lactoylglutathione lyase